MWIIPQNFRLGWQWDVFRHDTFIQKLKIRRNTLAPMIPTIGWLSNYCGEIFFRVLFKKHQTKFFLYSGIKTEKVNSKSLNEKLLSQWINGATQSDFINANMLELKLTGFVSNRGRQNVASYFCNELNVDWRLGAAYFEEQLIDYDVCSNWRNWAYLVGVRNDPRGHWYFNIEKQANDYDKNKAFRNLWLE